MLPPVPEIIDHDPFVPVGWLAANGIVVKPQVVLPVWSGPALALLITTSIVKMYSHGFPVIEILQVYVPPFIEVALEIDGFLSVDL